MAKTTGLDYAKVEKATDKLQEVQGELHRLSGNLPSLIRTEVQAQMGRDIAELLKAWPSHLKMMESMGKDVLELKVLEHVLKLYIFIVTISVQTKRN